MTETLMGLRGLLENRFAAGRLMEWAVGGLAGAACGERSAERKVPRHGDRDRDWHARAGTVELRLPKLRKPTSRVSLEPRRMRRRR